MQVQIGYSENPDSASAGREAAEQAMEQAGRGESCDLALLFCTARHNQETLRESVASAVGSSTRIYGGGAVGIITNDRFGYAGDQVGVACIWLDGVGCDIHTDGGLKESERETGLRLGQSLKEHGATPETPVMLFYNAVDRSQEDVRLIMATWLLSGLEEGLGFLPEALTGAGLQGDHVCSPTRQYIGEGIGEHCAMALAFSDELRIDSAIMHGCRPASGYYTVTKADGPVILEINGQRALSFMDALVGPAIAPADYPFFLLFGINHGDRWGEYNEDLYASRLCLGIDEARGGIVMFEPDMVAGTQFQLMFRTLELDYMKPKIEALFEGLDGREPVFAVYIDCAGRCAGYGGVDLEDALVVQETVGGRVPLLGLYTGVEIAPIGGRPRGLDWTGVFCLFSRGPSHSSTDNKPQGATPVWKTNTPAAPEDDMPAEAIRRLCEQNAAKVLALDTQSIAIRHELEQKRRGFGLLAELSVSLRQSASYESVFIPVAQRINAALNMQKTAVLIPTVKEGAFFCSVLQGYSPKEKARMAGQPFTLPAEMLDPEQPVLVTAADDAGRLSDLRTALGLPYFISSPVVLQNEVAAVLITGRMAEQTPFLSRLGYTDMETVQAISALLASVLVRQRLDAAEERVHIMVNAMPLCCVFWDENGDQIDCNEEALRLFGVSGKGEFLERFYTLAPAFQPDGRPSTETAREYVRGAFLSGYANYEWVYRTADGELMPSEVTLVRVPMGEDYTVTGYIRDLREQKSAMEEMRMARLLAEQNVRAKSEFLASVSHEVRTPLNGILAMARAVSAMALDDQTKDIVEQGMRSVRLLNNVIDSILDFSKMEAGQVKLAEKEFSVRETSLGVSEMLSKEASDKGVALYAEIEQSVPDTVVGDRARLEQALFNLMANAVKFTERGEVRLHVRGEESATPGKQRILFTVRDTGMGIDAEKLARLFEPLSAADTSYTRKRGGLGMGLAVSKSLAALMEGDITCESRVGEGSVFTLSVLLSLPESSSPSLAAEAAGDSLAMLAGMRVLLAEDNLINQMIVEELLTTAGIDVTTVGNGLEALSALREGAFDIVLMDIQMPEMDGLTAAAIIRQDPRFDDMPILAMTANAAEEHREESRKSGMNDHLTKPIDVDEVYAALKHWGKRPG